jgi:hypothetical protein
MLAVSYPTKKALKESVGKSLRYVETSLFGSEYRSTGKLTVVGPSPHNRKYFANIVMENDVIKRVM